MPHLFRCPVGIFILLCPYIHCHSVAMNQVPYIPFESVAPRIHFLFRCPVPFYSVAVYLFIPLPPPSTDLWYVQSCGRSDRERNIHLLWMQGASCSEPGRGGKYGIHILEVICFAFFFWTSVNQTKQLPGKKGEIRSSYVPKHMCLQGRTSMIFSTWGRKYFQVGGENLLQCS